MIIKQIFNNNIVSTVDDKNQELLILGRGIGFKFKVGDEIDEERIEKVFRLQDSSIYEKLSPSSLKCRLKFCRQRMIS